MLSLLGRSPRHSSLLKRVLLGSHRNLVSLRDNRLWVNGEIAPIPWVWLRDSCQCEKCVHPSTRQKLHRSSDIPFNISPISAVSVDNDKVAVDWPNISPSRGDPVHTSVYPVEWLGQHATQSRSDVYFSPLRETGYVTTWKSEDLKNSKSLWVDYSALKGRETRLQAFRQLLCYGILFIKGVDTTHKDSDNCELRQLAKYFGKIRETFYGIVWDVKSVAQSRNIAYTNLNLDLHMDLL
jgi:gamma-butyrobetaine dioxygenase